MGCRWWVNDGKRSHLTQSPRRLPLARLGRSPLGSNMIICLWTCIIPTEQHVWWICWVAPMRTWNTSIFPLLATKIGGRSWGHPLAPWRYAEPQHVPPNQLRFDLDFLEDFLGWAPWRIHVPGDSAIVTFFGMVKLVTLFKGVTVSDLQRLGDEKITAWITWYGRFT